MRDAVLPQAIFQRSQSPLSRNGKDNGTGGGRKGGYELAARAGSVNELGGCDSGWEIVADHAVVVEEVAVRIVIVTTMLLEPL